MMWSDVISDGGMDPRNNMKGMEKMNVNISLELDCWMEANVLEVFLYANNGEFRDNVQTFSYESLIDDRLESYTVLGKIKEEHYDDARDFVDGLRRLVDYAERRFEELKSNEDS